MTPKVKKAITTLIQNLSYEDLKNNLDAMVMEVELELEEFKNAKDIKDDIVKYLNGKGIDTISSKSLYNQLNKKFDRASVKLTITKYKNELWKFEKIEGTKRSFNFIYLGEIQ